METSQKWELHKNALKWHLKIAASTDIMQSATVATRAHTTRRKLTYLTLVLKERVSLFRTKSSQLNFKAATSSVLEPGRLCADAYLVKI